MMDWECSGWDGDRSPTQVGVEWAEGGLYVHFLMAGVCSRHEGVAEKGA